MDLEQAVRICRIIERASPEFGCHVALTGGCLYKDGERKDIDLLFYRVRQVKEIDYQGLFAALVKLGFELPNGFGWLFKSKYFGCPVDMFFPEEVGGGEYDPEHGKTPEQKSNERDDKPLIN